MMHAYLKQKAVLTVMTVSMASSFACSNAGKGDTVASNPVSQGPILAADVTKPSRILITPKAEWSELKGYIVGRADSSSLVSITDQTGKFGFQNLTAGIYDIVLEAKQKAVDGKINPVALKISGINLLENSDAQIRDIELKPYVKIEGLALLDGAASDSHAGIQVALSGTNLKTVTAADGSYKFEEIPEGNHAIEMQMSGFHSGFLLGKSYRAAERIPTISLVKDSFSLETGVHYLGEPLAAQSAQKISLHLKAPSPMNYFRYATGSDVMESRPWLLLQSSLEIDLPADKPEVRVQYSLDQRQLSPVFSASIPTQ